MIEHNPKDQDISKTDYENSLISDFKQTKSEKIVQKVKDIRDKTFQRLDSLTESDNDVEKIFSIFVKESKEMIEIKLQEFQKKIHVDLLPIAEVLENLQKFEENLMNFISQGEYDLRRKIGYNDGESPQNNENVEEVRSELKKRKKIPAKAVSVLREWLIANIQDPYPSNQIKEELAKKTNLNIKQVHNWFINARGRIWKKLFVQERFGNLVEKLYIESIDKTK